MNENFSISGQRVLDTLRDVFSHVEILIPLLPKASDSNYFIELNGYCVCVTRDNIVGIIGRCSQFDLHIVSKNNDFYPEIFIGQNTIMDSIPGLIMLEDFVKVLKSTKNEHQYFDLLQNQINLKETLNKIIYTVYEEE